MGVLETLKNWKRDEPTSAEIRAGANWPADLEDYKPTPRFPPFKLESTDKWTISIQAGSQSYSEPRENHPTLGDYRSVEIAIFYEGKWVNRGFDQWLDSFWDGPAGGKTRVAGEVPLETLAEIIEWLEENGPSVRPDGVYDDKKEGARHAQE